MREIEADNNAVRKTPDEIKKAILCDGPCNECAYQINFMSDGGCDRAIADDTIALIEQLERERDAAIEALHDVRANVAGLVCMVDRKDEKIPKWTNVAEHLPPTPGKYLVYSKVGTMYTSTFDPDIHKRWPHFGKVGVTHWMPLDEAPTAGASPCPTENGESEENA